MHKMEAVIGGALAQAGTIDIPLYDRQRRGPDKTYPLKISPDDIVILEGVVALLLKLRTARRVIRIYAFRREELRREIMAVDYRARGFTDEQFAELFAERQLDEAPIVSQTIETADFVVELQ
jgi:uridine kinase